MFYFNVLTCLIRATKIKICGASVYSVLETLLGMYCSWFVASLWAPVLLWGRQGPGSMGTMAKVTELLHGACSFYVSTGSNFSSNHGISYFVGCHSIWVCLMFSYDSTQYMHVGPGISQKLFSSQCNVSRGTWCQFIPMLVGFFCLFVFCSLV